MDAEEAEIESVLAEEEEIVCGNRGIGRSIST